MVELDDPRESSGNFVVAHVTKPSVAILAEGDCWTWQNGLNVFEHEWEGAGRCHGSTGSPLALLRRVLRGGVTVLEGQGF